MDNLSNLTTFVDRFHHYLNQQLRTTNYWAGISTLLLITFTLVFVAAPSPTHELFTRGYVNPFTEVVFVRSQNLTLDLTTIYNPGHHQAKHQFRMVMPLLVRTFDLNVYGLYLFKASMGVLLVYLTIRTAYRITADGAFEGGWLLVALAIVVLAYRGAWVHLSIFVGGIGMILLITVTLPSQ